MQKPDFQFKAALAKQKTVQFLRFMPLRKDIGRFRLEKEIPAGEYCYAALPTHKQTGKHGMRVRYCSYFSGARPMDCQCALYRGNPDGWFNLDAIKGCGINTEDQYFQEED